MCTRVWEYNPDLMLRSLSGRKSNIPKSSASLFFLFFLEDGGSIRSRAMGVWSADQMVVARMTSLISL